MANVTFVQPHTSETNPTIRVYHNPNGLDHHPFLGTQPRFFSFSSLSLVAIVETENLDEAFATTNCPEQPFRGTSIGDVFEQAGQYYLVAGRGFKKLHKVGDRLSIT